MRTGIRQIIAALLISTMLLTPGWASADQQVNEESLQLKLQTWLCPTDIDRKDFDFSTGCQLTTVPDLSFELSEPRGAGNPDPESATLTTDGHGSAILNEEWFGDGTYTLALDASTLDQIPESVVDYVLGCSVNGEDPQILDVQDYDLSSTYFNVPDGTSEGTGDIVCNWYNLPRNLEPGGTVTIDTQTCIGTDCTPAPPEEPLNATFGPTGDTIPIAFDDSGHATLEIPGPSTALYLDNEMGVITCTSTGEQPDPIDKNPPWMNAEPPFTSLDVMAGDQVECQWKVNQP